ncbi:MAG: GDP-mannose 4,6-dehydratase [Chloroflexi bacterium]|nr:GDP-mannose 4,6-dehydratase [Chloroflexota bacterium]
MPRAMITGGAGFVGSQLVRELLRAGYEVLVYDNLSVGRRENLPTEQSRLTLIEEDILDLGKLRDAVASFDPQIMFHLAAIHYIPYCNAHPLETIRVNVEGTQAILEACKTANVQRIVAISSAAVYRICDEANREMDLAAPCDIYGISKLFGEHLVRLFHEDTGISCMIARLFNVYGPRETNPHVIPALVGQLHRSNTVDLGNIDCKRDFIYVEDVAQALIRMAHWQGASSCVFNLGTGREYSIRELVEICEQILAKPITISVSPSLQRRTDRGHLLADITRIRTLLGWEPKYDLPQGMTELLIPLLDPLDPSIVT